MGSSSCDIMNTMNVHDISYNEEVPPTFIRHDSNSISNMEVAHENLELKNLEAINLGRHDAYTSLSRTWRICKNKDFF
jgi:hypothetical protein